MTLKIKGARENNLQDIEVQFGSGLTVVTGVSGSGKSSLIFNTLNLEAQRRLQEVLSLGAIGERPAPPNVEAITGLLPVVAVDQNLLNRNPNSTVATASGLHPFLRLTFARFGTVFCYACGIPVEVLDSDTLFVLLEQLPKPLTVIVPLLRESCGTHAALIEILIQTFSAEGVRVDGEIPSGAACPPDQPHTIEIILGTLLGDESPDTIRQVLDQVTALGGDVVKLKTKTDTKSYSLSPVCSDCGAWLHEVSPQDFNQRCPECEGAGCTNCQETGLHPLAAAVRWNGQRLDQLLGQSITQTLQGFSLHPLPANADRLQDEITSRLEALEHVGLGYLALDRSVPSLSRGEAQRLRLAVLLTSRLSDLLHLLDEPTIGQHPRDVQALIQALGELAGPVIYVEHDRIAAAAANAALDLGPGAGAQGGRIVFAGTPSGLWGADTLTGNYFSGRKQTQIPEKRPRPENFLIVKGAHLHNLRDIDVPFALNRLNVVCGVSGSGKSTLVEEVLFASLEAGQAVGCMGLSRVDIKAELVDQSPIGRNPRSNPATYTKLLDPIRDCFAANTGLDPTCFSFNTKEGACEVCQGMGAVEVKLRYLPSTWITCSECDGDRFTDEVLAAKVVFCDGLSRSIADFLDLSVSECAPLFQEAPGLSDRVREDCGRLCQALIDIGLGYLTLGQPSPTLSGGEAQRVKLAKVLGRRGLQNRLVILDEPTTGLHPADVRGLLVVLDRLVRAGGTVVVVEHELDLIRAADWLLELGPGAGPEGGVLCHSGSYESLGSKGSTPTSQALDDEGDLQIQPIRETAGDHSHAVEIRGARANNLQNFDLNLPKDSLTVVTGISGSGKSSLVMDIIEAEARRRYLESMVMYERQGLKEGPQANVDAVRGLGVTFSISTQTGRYDPRARLGDETEINPGLYTLFAFSGSLPCPRCKSIMMLDTEHLLCSTCNHKIPLPKPRHFNPKTYAAACQTCHGVGTLQDPRPEKLIIHPEKPMCAGAMYSPGFFPKGYLCKPFNGGYDLVQAFAARYGFDPASTPWEDMSPEAQNGFLFGDPEPIMVTYTSRSGKETRRKERFPGFYGWIRDWDQGGTYTETIPCPECTGAGLRQPFRSVRVQEKTIFELKQLSLDQLCPILNRLSEGSLKIDTLKPAMDRLRDRLQALCNVGLGYLNLDRYTATLSAGEAQRVRLAGLLCGGLTGLTLLLDEPTRGLHPLEVDHMVKTLQGLRSQGNTVIVVEHDLQVMQAADHIIDIGPDAGRLGGKVVAQGSPAEVSKAVTHTGRWLSGKAQIQIPMQRKQPTSWMHLMGAAGYNLKIAKLSIPLGVLVGVCGVSGSGKSTLIHDTLARILAPVKQTTSVAYEPISPEPYERLEGAPAAAKVVDQKKAGLHSPASFLGIETALRKLFSESAGAVSLGLDKKTFKRTCSACNGSGRERIEMGFLPDIFETCETCGGSGYPPQASAVSLHGLTLPQLLEKPLEEVRAFFAEEDSVTRLVDPALQVGLGYLILGQPGRTLSGGEAQRLKIAGELSGLSSRDCLYILDEPSLGQHLADLQRLIGVLRLLIDEGGSVLIVEHHPHILAACDWLIELGPGGGPAGGEIIAEGTPEDLAAGSTLTAPYLRQILGGEK